MKIIFIKKLIKENHTIKKLSKYITAFDYTDKVLIVLSAKSGGVSIISFTSIVGAPVGIASVSFIKLNSVETLIYQALIDMEKVAKNLLQS